LNYFAQLGTSGVSSAPVAASQPVYDAQSATANTHNVFAESGISHPSVLASSSITSYPQQQSSGSFMAIDTAVSSSRLEQESEGYLSPSSSEPTAATPDPSQFFSPSHHQNSRDSTHASLSTFGRSASPSPSITYTPTTYNALYNTFSTFSPPSASYRHANYSSSGGLSDSSMDESSASLAHTSNNPLLKQELHRNGKPKRPLNSFMIFARQRRPDLQKLNPNMKVADIAKELSKEWKDMPAVRSTPFHVSLRNEADKRYAVNMTEQEEGILRSCQSRQRKLPQDASRLRIQSSTQWISQERRGRRRCFDKRTQAASQQCDT
jgi:hypothetical protein